MKAMIEALPTFPILVNPQPAPPPDPVKPPSPASPVPDPGLPVPQPSRPPMREPNADPPPIDDPKPPPSWRPVAWCGMCGEVEMSPRYA
jgi:hypothetical protein